jgi:hypothetical protein
MNLWQRLEVDFLRLDHQNEKYILRLTDFKVSARGDVRTLHCSSEFPNCKQRTLKFGNIRQETKVATRAILLPVSGKLLLCSVLSQVPPLLTLF